MTDKNNLKSASYFGTTVYLKDFDPNETYNYIPNSYIPIVSYKGQAYIADDTPDGLTPDVSKTWRRMSTGGSGEVTANMPLRINDKGEIEIVLDEDYLTRFKASANLKKSKGVTLKAFGARKSKTFFAWANDDPIEGALTIQGTPFLDELVDIFETIEGMFENLTEAVDTVSVAAGKAQTTADAVKKQSDLTDVVVKGHTTEIAAVTKTADAATVSVAAVKKVADAAVQTVTATDTDSVTFTVKKVGTDIQMSAVAKGGSGDNSKVVVNIGTSSYNNDINFLGRDGNVSQPSGLVLDVVPKSLLTVKTITSCFRTLWERTDAKTIRQIVATLNKDGTIYGWRQYNGRNDVTQIQTPYAHKVDNLKSFDLGVAGNDMYYSYVNPSSGFLTITRLEFQADNSVKAIDYVSDIKPTDHNTVILNDPTNTGLNGTIWVGYWTATGFSGVTFTTKTWGWTNTVKVIKTVNNGKGLVKAVVKPSTGTYFMWFEQTPNNVLIAFTSSQAISPVDKTNIINKFTIADIAYDVDTDLLLVFYFYGEDSLSSLMPSQPMVAGYRYDRCSNFQELVPWSILAGWCFPKTSSGGSVSLGVITEAGSGQIVFAYRDANGQGKGVTFTLNNGKCNVTDSLLVTSGGGTGYFLSKDNCGKIVPAGARHMLITYFQSDTTECVPMTELYFTTNIGVQGFAGVGTDNKGNVMVKGIWTTSRIDLIIGATYYLKSKGEGKREYLLSTEPLPNARVGVAVSAKAILIN